MRILHYFLLISIMLSGMPSWAEGGDTGGVDNALYEIGVHVGNLLPNQIPGVTEITGLGGLRLGARIAPLSYVEGGVMVGNGNGVEWKNVHADVRMDIPVENMIALAYIGADAYYYRDMFSDSHIVFGGHAGGGLQTQVAGDVWLRGDMKFSVSPGTSLYVGFAIELRFPDK